MSHFLLCLFQANPILMMSKIINGNISSFLEPVSPNSCGTDHSFDETVRNYKYYCDGLLVSIIGCLGILGKNISMAFYLNRQEKKFHSLQATCSRFLCCQNLNCKIVFTGCCSPWRALIQFTLSLAASTTPSSRLKSAVMPTPSVSPTSSTPSPTSACAGQSS